MSKGTIYSYRNVSKLCGLVITTALCVLCLGPFITVHSIDDAPFPDSSLAPHVLLLNSYHQGFQWTDDVTSAIVSSLPESIPELEFFIEYMDSKRFFDKAHSELFHKNMALKYVDTKIDIVITSDDNALQFVRDFHDEIFANVPVVFCGVNRVDDALSAPKRYYTGIVETLDIVPNLKWVQAALPHVKNIVVVTDGTSTGLGTRAVVKDAASEFETLKFTYLNGESLSTPEMLGKLRELDHSSIVIAPAWYHGMDERFYDNKEIYPLMSEASPVPIIGLSAANLGFGIIGGKMNSGATQGAYAARIAARILLGKDSTAGVPVQTQSQNQFIFDYRELKRFGIDEKVLPQGSKVFYRPFSFFKTYKKLVGSVIVVFFLFLALIIWLLVTVSRLGRARHHLVRREEYFRTILDSIGDAVIVTNAQGYIKQMNPLAGRMVGKTVETAIDKQFREVVHLVHADTGVVEDDPVKHILTTPDSTWMSGMFIFKTNDMRTLRLRGSGAVIKGDMGQATGVVLVFRDVTEEYLMETELHQGQKMEAVGRLAGGIAHDFNNMLGGIIGSAELALLQSDKDNPVCEAIKMIITAAENAASLTHKLLTFSRKGGIQAAPVDVHACIRDALSILERSLDKRVNIQRELKAKCSVVIGDAGQIQNAIINLGINAGQAMECGGVLTVCTTNADLDKDDHLGNPSALASGLYVIIEVCDTGKGIHADIMPYLFDPFFTTKEVGKGTGLGLAAVFGTVKDHHGTITVSSEVGVGTQFRILLPIAQEFTHAAKVDASVKVPTGKGCILVIDDEPIVRTTVVALLTTLEYTVMAAEDGIAGVAIFRENMNSINLVLLDMVMPKMGGKECFTQIRKLNPSAKVLISSGYASREDMDDICVKGALGVINKPYRLAELAKAVGDAIRV